MTNVDGVEVRINGSYAEVVKVESGGGDEHADVKTLEDEKKETEASKVVNSSPQSANSPVLRGASSSSPMTKGYGLKKWRRIKRDFVKDPSTSIDSGKILKRGLSASVNQTKPSHATDIKQKTEGSAAFEKVPVKNHGVNDVFAFNSSSSDSRLAVGQAFLAGTDSENSEDRSSKSSTAASAPKMKYDTHTVMGNARERNRMKNLGAKTLGNSAQRVQQGKSRTDTSKKPRGEIEKENSYSSMESDSRSSSVAFISGGFSVVSNGKQSGRLGDYDGENSDEAQASEQQLNEELHTTYGEENVGEVEVQSKHDSAANLSWDAKEEEGDQQSSKSQDPLVESLLSLQSVQEALESEVQKFVEIGKEFSLPSDNSIPDGSLPADLGCTDPDQLNSEEIASASISLDTTVVSLKEKVKDLEMKLEEVQAMLRAKESRVVKLETDLLNIKSLEEASGSTNESSQHLIGEIESNELESLFKQKIESEVEYLTISITMQKLRAALRDQIALLEEQKSLAQEQEKVFNKLGQTESKAQVIKKQAEEKTYCDSILVSEEAVKMQKKLILLLLVLGLFLLNLMSPSTEVVPT
ncbi:hypothetical protein RJ641_034850 [Dillenia turbinata]|uniref:WPP domain-containing protein n=1 Tax=Dillenia turbinata TaxID=194707 RepID=A0AAN8ZHN9_9MAGN